MPKLVNQVPKYRKHSSGQARVTINGRDYLLGPHGSQASHSEYDRRIAEYLASGRSGAFGIESESLTMAMLMRDYLQYARDYYGTEATSEWHRIKLALRVVKSLYADTLAHEFGPVEYKAVRERMIDADLCRNEVNARMKRVARMFKWAAGEGLLPPFIYETLRLVPSLRRGRTKARETEPVKPVPRSNVEATCKFLSPTVEAMVRFQLLTDCRPGEVCKLTPSSPVAAAACPRSSTWKCSCRCPACAKKRLPFATRVALRRRRYQRGDNPAEVILR